MQTNTTPDNIDTIVKTMYDARLLLRNIYQQSSINDIYVLKDNIEKCIKRILKDDYISIDINILLFEIDIVLKEDSIVSNKKKSSLIENICNIIRSFTQCHTSNTDILLYISNLDNPIFDVFTIGNSIKLIL